MANLVALINSANVMVMDDCEAIKIETSVSEDNYIYGTGEESGESYRIHIDEVDVNTTLFYQESLINNEDFGQFADIRETVKQLFNKLLDKDPQKMLEQLKTINI